MQPVHDAAGKLLGEKVLVQETEDVDGTRLEAAVPLNVSTVDTHPGTALAYRIDVK